MAAPISVFISYAREDSAFVDRLEADLQAHNLRTWVDRRKLEGGQVWMDELEKAIGRCQITLVVLSPKAVESKYVRMEYRFAQSLNKLIIPLEYQTCSQIPIDLNSLQWIVFKDSYEQGLNDLLIALNPIETDTLPPPAPPVQATNTLSFTEATKEPDLVVPQPAPPPPDPDLYALYRAGIVAKAEDDLERTAILWQQILSRDPNFGNGILSVLMEQVQQELHPYRIRLLRDRAMKAQAAGEWGQAIGAWEALLGLEPSDKEALDYRAIAEENQKFAWMYETALQFFTEGQNQAATIQLGLLWRYARKYGDPAHITEKLGLNKLGRKYEGELKSSKLPDIKFTLELIEQIGETIKVKFFNSDNSKGIVYHCIGISVNDIIKFTGNDSKGYKLYLDGSIGYSYIESIVKITREDNNAHQENYSWFGELL